MMQGPEQHMVVQAASTQSQMTPYDCMADYMYCHEVKG